jgi:uncharacterized protein (DUF58 family)
MAQSRIQQLRAGFTTRGRCLLAAGMTALVCGLLFGSVDLARAGTLVLAAPIVATLVVNRSQLTIASRRSVTPARSTLGTDVSVALTVTNRSVLPTGPLMLEDRLPVQITGRARFSLDGLSGRESRSVAYRLPRLGRGRYSAGPLRMRLTDPFGLIDTSRSFTATSSFVVTPVVDALPQAQPPYSVDVGENAGSHSIGSHGADDASTREYRHGDDLRKIHWRSTARIGTLMVRHEERPWQGHATLVLDLRAGAHDTLIDSSSTHPAQPDEPPRDIRRTSSLEWAISAIASIGSHLAHQGRELSLVESVSDAERVRLGGAWELVEHLAEVRPSGANDLHDLVPIIRDAARDSTVIAVLGRLDLAGARALATVQARGSGGAPFVILLDTPTWRHGRAAGVEPEPRPPSAEFDAAVVETLRAAGWWVVRATSADTTPIVWRYLMGQRTLTTPTSVARSESA